VRRWPRYILVWSLFTAAFILSYQACAFAFTDPVPPPDTGGGRYRSRIQPPISPQSFHRDHLATAIARRCTEALFRKDSVPRGKASRKKISDRQLHASWRRLDYRRRARAGVQGLPPFLHRGVDCGAFAQRIDDSRAGAARSATSSAAKYASWPSTRELRRVARGPAPALCKGAVEPCSAHAGSMNVVSIERPDNPSMLGGRGV
jgi:hypothetical protein